VSAVLSPATVRLAWEDRLRRYRLTYPNPPAAVRHDVDWMRFPPIAGIYAELAPQPDDMPPTADEFEAAVYAQTGLPRTDGTRWRLLAKFYPSLVAQQHLALVFLERFPHVTWSVKEDLTGIDLHVAYRGLAIGILSAIGSADSQTWQARKEQRHPPTGHVYPLKLYRRPYEYVVGPFWLHHPDLAERQVKAFAASILGGSA